MFKTAYDQFQILSSDVDREVLKLPTIEKCKYLYDKCPFQVDKAFAPFTEKLKNVLNYLLIRQIRIDSLEWYGTQINFKLSDSPYFRLGSIGKWESIAVDEDLEGVISVGFEYPEYDDKDMEPEIRAGYEKNGERLSDEEQKPISSQNWRRALEEFFDFKRIKCQRLLDDV